MVLFVAYLLVMYCAFAGKLLFYYHFHDVYNRNMWLGKNADKKNLLDIFFNQNHGGWILLGSVAYGIGATVLGKLLLALPAVPWLVVDNVLGQYVANTVMFLATIALYYWLNFGGTFRHRLKPEWDEVPEIVKNDGFLGKATMDDLVALKIVWKHPVPEFLANSDEVAKESIGQVQGDFAGAATDNPLFGFKHIAKGAKLKQPRHIFFILEESHCQTLYDDIYNQLAMVQYTKKLRQEKTALVLDNFQPGGMISQTSIGSLLSGIYDCDLELNENKNIWYGDGKQWPTAMASQLERLGYRTSFWYGGSLSWGSLMHFLPAVGFSHCYGGPDFCGAQAPQTWLGVYDHIFLQETAKKIKAEDTGKPEFHFIYTTSNHGPYNIPYEEYGITEEMAVPKLLGKLKTGDKDMRRFAGILYADKAVADFVSEMRAAYPDSLFILTGDHASAVVPTDKELLPRKEQSLREHILTSVSFHHPDLEPTMLAGNTLGEHLNILPTLMELLAPAGFEYYSLKSSLTEPLNHIVTPYSWMTKEKIGFYQEGNCQPLAASAEVIPTEANKVEFLEEREAWRNITGWMVRHPELYQK